MRFLAWHMGLGDAIAFAQLAVDLSGGERLVVPCWERNEISVRCLFAAHPNIHVFVITPEEEKEMALTTDAIRIGCYSEMQRLAGEDSIEWVYRTAGKDLSTRFDGKIVEKACRDTIQLERPHHRHSLIHDDAKRGFFIDRKYTSYPDIVIEDSAHQQCPITSWMNLILTQPEIHCIDSSVLHLVEQLEPEGKLFYHKYARPGSESYNTLRHNWTILE